MTTPVMTVGSKKPWPNGWLAADADLKRLTWVNPQFDASETLRHGSVRSLTRSTALSDPKCRPQLTLNDLSLFFVT